MTIRSYTFIGGANGDVAGNSVASAGDVDGDGFDDILIGAPNADNGGTNTSLAYLLTAADLAAADAADGTADGVIDLDNVDEQGSSYFFTGIGFAGPGGLTVSSAGDVDGDGLDDLLIGDANAAGGTGNSGEAYLLTAADLAGADAADGNADGWISLTNVAAQAGSYRFTGTLAGENAGAAVASAGDVDGDGQDDLLIGAPDGSLGLGVSINLREGVVHLMAADDLAAADAADGSIDGVIDLANVAAQPGSYSFSGEDLNYEAGASITSLGDIDGDGLDDFAIGSPHVDDSATRGGATYVIGSSDLAAADAADGTVDGQVSLASIAAQNASYKFLGTTSAENSGVAIANVGDQDGDGLNDLLIGTVVSNPGVSTAAYLVSTADFAAADAADGAVDGVVDMALVAQQPNSYQFNAPAPGQLIGFSVSSAGDIDGDGQQDLLIGSLGSDVTYLVAAADLEAADTADGAVDGVIDLGNVSLLDNSYELIAGSGLDNAGNAVSSAGDVDGDGLGDLLIGAPGSSTGGAYLLTAQDLASADDDGTGQDGIIDLGNLFYDSVVEGTGGDDLIDRFFLGDPELDQVDNNDNPAGTNDDVIQAGGGDDTILASAGDDDIDGGADRDTYQSADLGTSYTFVGTEAGDLAGISVSDAGDVDGDGLDDLMIGAISADGGGSASGESYLISGAGLAAADAADGNVDGVIDLDNVNEQAGSYQFIGAEAGDLASTASSAGDVDGDGLDDLILGASVAASPDARSGETYLVTAADLAAADAADGSADGVIDLGNVAAQHGSYQFNGVDQNDELGFSVSSAGDIDGDGRGDLIIGARSFGPEDREGTGATYVVTAADLAAADAADGSADGVIEAENIAAQGGSYEFRGEEVFDQAGFSVSSIGDVDGDGLDDLIIGAPEVGRGGISDLGSSYLVTAADLADADAADGSADGVIDLGNVATQTGSYRFDGTENGDLSGISVSSAGDVDGDGLGDLIIGASGANGGGDNAGESYLITAADLADLDAADGTVDGVVELANVAGQGGSYQFNGTEAGDSSGQSVSSAGDVDGDGLDDLIIGARTADDGGDGSGESYLISGADLAAADAADGTVDGIVDLDNVNEQAGSYQFIGADGGDSAGRSVSSAGDVDGDGLADLLVGASTADGGGDGSGESYLISGGDLAALDALDGTPDGVIDLGLVGIIDDTVTVDVNDDGAGTVTGTYVTGTDSVTSVETFVAGENPDEADTITIADTGPGFTTLDISGLDDNAEGTYVPGNGDPTVSFGPSTGTLLSDVIQGIDGNAIWAGGTFQITGGDESGQVGNISFENFETINFAVTCFARGTMIATRKGLVAVEDLQIDDAVTTMDHGYRPIRWIGSRVLDTTDLAANPKLRAIRIRAGALGNNLPERDLRVSPQHRVLVRSRIAERMFGATEVLVAAKQLLELDGFEIDTDAADVEYFHMLFDEHEIVFSNGAPTESLFTGPEALKSVAPEAREEILTLFPELSEVDFKPAPSRPIPESGRLARKLAARHLANRKPLLMAAE